MYVSPKIELTTEERLTRCDVTVEALKLEDEQALSLLRNGGLGTVDDFGPREQLLLDDAQHRLLHPSPCSLVSSLQIPESPSH